MINKGQSVIDWEYAGLAVSHELTGYQQLLAGSASANRDTPFAFSTSNVRLMSDVKRIWLLKIRVVSIIPSRCLPGEKSLWNTLSPLNTVYSWYLSKPVIFLAKSKTTPSVNKYCEEFNKRIYGVWWQRRPGHQYIQRRLVCKIFDSAGRAVNGQKHGWTGGVINPGYCCFAGKYTPVRASIADSLHGRRPCRWSAFQNHHHDVAFHSPAWAFSIAEWR